MKKSEALKIVNLFCGKNSERISLENYLNNIKKQTQTKENKMIIEAIEILLKY